MQSEGAKLLPRPAPPSAGGPLSVSQEQLAFIIQTVQGLKKNGATEENSPEYAKLITFLRNYSASVNKNANAQSSTPAAVSAVAVPNAATSAPAAAAALTNIKKELGENERKLLKLQIFAYKQLAGNKPLSEPLRKALMLAGQFEDTTGGREPSKVPADAAKLVDAAFKFSVGNGASHTNGGLPTLLNTIDFARSQLLLHQNLAPVQYDPLQIIKDREEKVQESIDKRIKYLETLPGNLSNDQVLPGNGTPKLRAIIELKGLRLVEKQRQLRQEVIKGMAHSTLLQTALDRAPYKKARKVQLREFNQTEKIEKDLRSEREKRERQKLIDYCNQVIGHGRDMFQFHKNQNVRASKLGTLVMKFHTAAERDEQKRASKLSQERLNALRANDEEAYLKLVDQAKDTRITQILSQTTGYLANLSAAVVTQQESVVGEAPIVAAEEEDASKLDYYSTAHKIKEEIKEQSGLLVGGKLKDYQIKGLQWMVSLYNNRLNGILADEMGLGKTIQTISLITYLMEKKKQYGPFLVIVPLGTITNWQLEFEKWAPAVNKIVFKGQPHERRRLAQEIRGGNFNVIITTYEYIIKEKALLSKIKWIYIIIDEGHRMKNTQSKLSITLMQFYNTRYRLILTGTPLQNNLPELWALLNFILPKIFNSIKTFDEWFSSPFSAGGTAGQAALELNEEERLLMVKGLHKALRPFLLRRLKKDVESELPDKVEIIVKCAMSTLQRKITERVKILRNIGPFDVNSGARALNNLVMQLRKICNHPFVFPEVEELFTSPDDIYTNDNIFRSAGKFELLDRILPKFFRTAHRVLMFFQMTQIMDIMEDFLRYRGWKFLRLDGHIKSEDRGALLKEFNSANSEYDIFILSTRAGGLGLNLQTADTVVIFDSDWNPHQDLQAQDRAHRIGQTKEVRIIRLITTNSIEEHILSKAQQKLNLDEKVIQAGKFDQKTSEKEREELLRLLFEKDDAKEDTEENAEFTDEQLNEMLARSPEEVEIFAKMDQERNTFEAKTFPGRPRLMAETELPEFYQVDLETLREDEKEDLMGGPRGARERKSVRYDDNLTEEQWLDAIEEGDIEGAIQRKQLRRAAQGGDVDDDDDNNDDYVDDVVQNVEEPPKRKRGRPPKNPPAETSDNGDEGLEHRRRGPKKGSARKPKVREVEDSLPRGTRSALNRIFDACLEAIKESSVKEEDGRPRFRAAMFEELPSKRAYKDYYNVIKNPIALETIERKCGTLGYSNVADFKADLKQMFENARTYNEETSQIAQDATFLESLVNEKLEELTPGGEFQPDPESDGEGENDDDELVQARTKRKADDMDEDDDGESVYNATPSVKIKFKPPLSGFKISLPKRPRVSKADEEDEYVDSDEEMED
ncbi:hypothetical protein HDU97_007415 [Phlyctochytrium planicorne]|nr:hypothetical protein HDU97_007415 [Phlyctochytrium planicorne]